MPMATKSKQESLADADAACCAQAEKFATIYYEAFDKRRHVVPNMYTDGAVLVWNGKPLTGQTEIAEFLKALPPSRYAIEALDAQNVHDSATGGQRMMVLLAAGNVDFEGRTHAFTQTFILTMDGDVWKITSDRLRFVD